eukprot:5816892-Alexandrium_andersonii.AAC.1
MEERSESAENRFGAVCQGRCASRGAPWHPDLQLKGSSTSASPERRTSAFRPSGRLGPQHHPYGIEAP